MRQFFAVLLFALAPLQAAEAKGLIVFLHNKFLETSQPGDAHPKFGVYDVEGIHQALAARGKLEAPRRGANADPAAAAAEVAQLVRREIAAGRDPSQIKIVGGSKGAYIAMLVSAQLQNDHVRYVLLGGCFAALTANPPTVTGRVLSIYDATDQVAGPCPSNGPFVAKAAAYEQIMIDSGAGHGFQFVADERWLAPALAW